MKRLLIISLVIFSSIYAKPQVIEQDSLALVSLYNATNGVNWYFNNHWLEAGLPVTYWFGIEIENSRVVQINLPYNNLVGNIPSEIGNLDSLSILDLSSNSINGIPSSIGNLITLDTLALFGCPINSLPPEIGGLSDLKYLNICFTQITTLPDELGDLSRLEYFYGWNGMLQTLPESIGNMTSLKEINLAANDISNLPSSIGNCINLIRLQLNANQIPAVPVEIGNLINLEYLILGGNNIGTLPNEIFNLTSLKYLNFAANGIDSISPLIGNLTSLENFQFFSNNITYIPEEIGNCISLSYINGYENNIDSLPQTLLNIPVTTLFLPYNALTFDDIEPIFYIIGFEYWGQDSIGVNIDTTVFVDSTYYMEIVTGGEFNNYQWKKNNVIIEGATNNYLELSNITLADSGIYNCEITNSVATGLTLQSRLIDLHVEIYTKIDKSIYEPNAISFSIFPNPAFDKISIQTENAFPLKEYEILLFNQYGKLIRKDELYSSKQSNLDISRLNKGVYYIQVSDTENKHLPITKKIIKL
jgi:Leucine-rich repeat (LRR) protein